VATVGSNPANNAMTATPQVVTVAVALACEKRAVATVGSNPANNAMTATPQVVTAAVALA
jgi:hypothetical protein